MAALSGEKTLAELSAEFGVHPTMISNWKQELVKRAGELFGRGTKAPAAEDAQKVIDDLHRKIGQLQVECDFLAGQPAISRLLRGGSKRAPGDKVYPYLLRGKTIDRANQVWAADITYIPMRQGFLYLVAIIDWATRRVLSWRLSNTLTAGFCVEALSEALARFGKPGIFNTDQSLPSRKRGARNSPVTSSPICCGITRSRSAWTDADAATTTSSSSAGGGACSTNGSTCV